MDLTLVSFDLVAVLALVFGLYAPRHHRRDLVTAFLGVNLGVLAVSTILAVSFHRELGEILYAGCGVSRNESGLRRALEAVGELRTAFWSDVRVVGAAGRLNQELEKALRVADFLELAEIMVLDALDRRESAGAHFREEFSTP